MLFDLMHGTENFEVWVLGVALMASEAVQIDSIVVLTLNLVLRAPHHNS